MCFCKFLSERKNTAEQEFLLSVLIYVWCLAEGHLQRPVLNLSRGGLCLVPGSPQLLQASPWSVLPSDPPKERSRIIPESADCYCWMCAGTLCPSHHNQRVWGAEDACTHPWGGGSNYPHREYKHTAVSASFVRMPSGPWPGKTAQMDVSAVHLPKLFNLKRIFSSVRRRSETQRA